MITVFVDTETTGVHRGYRPWEIAFIRRDAPGLEGADTECTIFVDTADLDLANADPAALAIARFEERHPQRGGALGEHQVLMSGADAAQEVARWTLGAKMCGVNTSYDLVGLDGLLARHGLAAGWFYVPMDMLGIGYGYLRGQGVKMPPASSEQLAAACGVQNPSSAERHTAMGDARWAARWHDRIEASAGVGAF